jgi:polyhydroxyalkanoate synthesis regulator phasin
MARDDRFRKYQEAGADFLETARARAEDFLRELSKVGEGTQSQGKDALEDLLEGSRKGTERLIGSIRDEIRSQLSLLGLATKEDLASLERRLGGSASRSGGATKSTASAGGASKSASSKSTAARKTATKKASGTTKSAGTTRKTATAKSAAKRSTPAKKATGRA